MPMMGRLISRFLSCLLILALSLGPSPAGACPELSRRALRPMTDQSGLEEELNLAELKVIKSLRLGDLSVELVKHGWDYYLRAAEEIFVEANRHKSLQRLPLKESTLVTVGRDSSNAVQIDRSKKNVSRQQMAFLLDFGGAVQIIDLGSRNGTWVDGRSLQPPTFVKAGDSSFFIFQRGNRYFIAGDRIVGPKNLWVPLQEIPFHKARSRKYPELRATATLGRDTPNDIEIGDPKVSGEQDQLLLLQDGSVWIQDLDSSNGTFVGGEKIAKAVRIHQPLQEGIQVEVDSPYAGFYDMKQAIRKIMFLDPKEEEAIARNTKNLNQLMGTVRAAEFPFDLAFAITRGSLEDVDANYTIAMENYLSDFTGLFLKRLHEVGKGETLTQNLATFLLYFLMDDRYPELQYQAAFAFRDMNFPREPDTSYASIVARLVTTPNAKRYFDRILIQSLGRLGGIPQLIELLQEGTLDERLKLAALKVLKEHLQEVDQEKILTLLSRLSYDESRSVVLATMDIFEKLGNPEAALYLSTFAFQKPGSSLQDREIQTRAEALFHRFTQRLIDQIFSKSQDTVIIQAPLQDQPSSETSQRPPPSPDNAGLEEGIDFWEWLLEGPNEKLLREGMGVTEVYQLPPEGVRIPEAGWRFLPKKGLGIYLGDAPLFLRQTTLLGRFKRFRLSPGKEWMRIKSRTLRTGRPLFVGRTDDPSLFLEEAKGQDFDFFGIPSKPKFSNISHKHTKILWKGDFVYLRDLGSSEGTFLNSVDVGALKEALLKPTDVVDMNLWVLHKKFDPILPRAKASRDFGARSEMVILELKAPVDSQGRIFLGFDFHRKISLELTAEPKLKEPPGALEPVLEAIRRYNQSIQTSTAGLEEEALRVVLEENPVLKLEDGFLRGSNGQAVPAPWAGEFPNHATVVAAASGLEEGGLVYAEDSLRLSPRLANRSVRLPLALLLQLLRQHQATAKDLVLAADANSTRAAVAPILATYRDNRPPTFLILPQLAPDLTEAALAAFVVAALNHPDGLLGIRAMYLVQFGDVSFFVFA